MDKLTKCKTCSGEGVLHNCDGTQTEKCVTCDGAGLLDVQGQIDLIERLLKSQLWNDDVTAEMNRQLKALKELLS